MDEYQWWWQQNLDEQWAEENDDAIERANQRISDCVSQSSGDDHRGAEGLGEPVLQKQVRRPRQLLGRLPGGSVDSWAGGCPIPDDPGWRSLSGDALAAYLGAVDAF